MGDDDSDYTVSSARLPKGSLRGGKAYGIVCAREKGLIV